MNSCETLIIGAGVIGSAVARALAQRGARGVVVLEKEDAPARHTSGRNSGVIHSGFNPKPGTMKASFCVEGNRRLREFCRDRSIPMEEVGTVVAALHASELPALEELLARGKANGVPGIEIVDGDGLRRLEPHSAGIAALHAPSGAITSGRLVTEALVSDASRAGAAFRFGEEVRAITPSGRGLRVETTGGGYLCERLVNCAGVNADRIAHLMGVGVEYRIVPFRGEYYRAAPSLNHLLRSMLYPVPDLKYPFLGVHWTRTVDGQVLIGPNAMLAAGREAYSTFGWSAADLFDMLRSRNFFNMIRGSEFRRMSHAQLRLSLSRARFVAEAAKLIPGVKPEDFTKGKSGIRPQLVNREGELIEDVVVLREGSSVHVLNAISPGFTCSLPFADHIVSRLG